VTGPSRRDLFRGLLGRARPKPVLVGYVGPADSTRPPDAPRPPRFGRGTLLPVLRPPGAIEESAFLAACTRCNACVEACPHDAITLAPDRLRGIAGTPVVNPAASPCRVCADRPCAAACEPQALRLDLPPRMGTAVISPLACLAHRNSPCSTCVEQCPVDGAIRWENGRPTVDPAACTGCGVCQSVCPAPQNAVMILPAKDRPRPATREVRDAPRPR
jgi:ferredoxin-type protein NapG